jgi:periplasmic copper chaperone A
MKILSLLLLIFVMAPVAQAHEIKAGPLVIIHPTVDEAEKGQALARGSMEIRNEGKISDELLSIKAEFADEVTIETPGKVSVPANGRVLVPIAFHGISRKLSEDEAYSGDLAFAKAGVVKIDFLVHPHAHSSSAHCLQVSSR